MTLSFDKRRMIAAAIASLAGLVLCILVLILVFDSGSDSVPMSALRGGFIGGAVATGIYSIVFLIHATSAGRPIVTIDDRGIEFHRAEVGLVPWNSIEKATVERIMGAKRLSVTVAPPAPRPSFVTKLLFGLAAIRRDGRTRLTIPFGRFGANEAEVQAILDRRGARA